MDGPLYFSRTKNHAVASQVANHVLTFDSLLVMLRPSCPTSLLSLQVGLLLRQELPEDRLENPSQYVRASEPRQLLRTRHSQLLVTSQPHQRILNHYPPSTKLALRRSLLLHVNISAREVTKCSATKMSRGPGTATTNESSPVYRKYGAFTGCGVQTRKSKAFNC